MFALRGETALSVTLTALSSLLSILTIPFIVGLGFMLITGADTELAMPAGAMMQRLFLMTALPILLGMGLRYAVPGPAEASLRFFRVLSLLLILTIIAISVRDAYHLIEGKALSIMMATLALVIGATLLGLPELNITPVAYGLLNYLFIGVLLLFMHRARSTGDLKANGTPESAARTAR